jgi:glycosyltransferase involved in cell wall biosynthesis
LFCIENGVSIPDKRTIISEKKDNTLCIGRICPEKGYHVAIRASLRAGFTPVLAGRVFSYLDHQKYFDMQIKPFVDTGRCRFIGIVGQEEKLKLFSTARCLLVPSYAQETSSLVTMEAMAFGIPVVAFKSGALNDIVRDRITGFLVDDEDEMVEAIVASAQIDSEVCHSVAKEYYSVERMTSQYLSLYRNLIEKQR